MKCEGDLELDMPGSHCKIVMYVCESQGNSSFFFLARTCAHLVNNSNFKLAMYMWVGARARTLSVWGIVVRSSRFQAKRARARRINGFSFLFM